MQTFTRRQRSLLEGGNSMRSDVVIIGAGPSGLTAAIELAKNHVSVTVVDEYFRPGGRLLGQLYEDPYLPEDEKVWNGKEIAQQLTLEAEKLGVQIFTNTVVWSVKEGWEVELTGSVKGTLTAKALLLATGSIEKALPVPGWTLPGVYTVGAAQTFTNLHRVCVGRKVIIVGIDPLSLSVMTEMKKAGIEVIGVTLPPPVKELGNGYTPTDALRSLEQVADFAPNRWMRQLGKALLGRFDRFIAHALRLNLLKVDGTSIYLRKALLSIEGETEVEAVTLQDVSVDGELIGKPYRKEVDAVCLSGGLYPSMDLAQVGGCKIVHIPELGGMVPLHGPDMSTLVKGLFLSGNITGIEGAKVAMAQGKVAAVSILGYLGKKGTQSLDEAMEEVEIARKQSPIKFMPDIEIGRQKMLECWREHWNEGYDYLSM